MKKAQKKEIKKRLQKDFSDIVIRTRDGRKTTILTTKTLLFVTCEVCFVIRFSVGYDIEIVTVEIVTVNYHLILPLQM